MQRFFCALFLLFSCGVLSAQARPPQDKPAEIHEAFVVPAKATPLLNATLKEPPERIVERIPPNDDPKAEWIPGYWEWNEKQGDFSWICGVWRRPPPGMVWNPGFWKKFPEGWVRIVGFWHNQPAQNIRVVSTPPPAPIDEQVQAPPGKDFFWAPGFWQFSHVDNRYGWVPGRWEPLDQSFVLSPGYYVWREEGYILVPPFWDYPLEERGKAYCSLFLDESQRRGYVHTPTVVMQPEMIIEQIFPYWPDYICFFHHWHHFHPGFWDNWCCTPPWWGWDAWWGFGPFHMWDLWWWWSHPGFSFPWWMPGWMGGWIVPPGGIVIDIMIGFGPPIFIGPFGPWPLMALLDAIFSVTGKNLPILPADPAMREEILKKVPPLVGDSGNQRPSGTPDGRVPEKPFDQPQTEVPRSPGGSAVPSKPRPAQPPVQTYPQPPVQTYPQPQPRPQPPVQTYPQPPYTPEPPQQFYPRPRPRPMPMPPEQGYPRPRPRPQPPRYPWPPSDSYRPQPDRGDVTPPSRKPPQTYPPQGQSEITPRTPQFQQPRINPQALERFRQQQQLQPRQTPQTMTPY